MWWGVRGHKWRHNIAHTRFTLDKQGYTQALKRMHTLTLPGSRTHACARIHKQIRNTYCSPREQWLRQHDSMLRYKYIPCLVFVVCCVGTTSAISWSLIQGSATGRESNCVWSRTLKIEAD
jgi:hypothetical protein